ncbi:MAG: hypothetical protein Q8N79_04215 [Candidatus Methanoperedens sp.]|nr:hypothetical protein [Candidatus Methanoperedens sp.]
MAGAEEDKDRAWDLQKSADVQNAALHSHICLEIHVLIRCVQNVEHG